jgi:pilus assembly protein CpaF
MAIRKFSKANLDIDWLVEMGTLSEAARQYLKICVNAERNLLVVGGTSSGKTSLLNALSMFIPNSQRIVVIEDSAELQIQQEHVVSLETRAPDRFGRGEVSIRELFRASLRLRPDRIIIGEVRGGEALDMIQAMTSGHGGSMGTLHAESSEDAMGRLETLALMSKVDLPLHALRGQIASAIDVIVTMSRHLGGRRQVTGITEVEALAETGLHKLRPIFQLAPAPDDEDSKRMQLKPAARRSSFAGGVHRELFSDAEPEVRDLFEAEPVHADN